MGVLCRDLLMWVEVYRRPLKDNTPQREPFGRVYRVLCNLFIGFFLLPLRRTYMYTCTVHTRTIFSLFVFSQPCIVRKRAKSISRQCTHHLRKSFYSPATIKTTLCVKKITRRAVNSRPRRRRRRRIIIRVFRLSVK